MNMKKAASFLIAGLIITGMTPSAALANDIEDSQPQAANNNVVDISMFIQGYEWGPGVSKLVLKLQNEVSEVTAEDCAVTTAGAGRIVKDIYVCNEKGDRAESASQYAAIEMETTSEVSGSPFVFNTSTMRNNWAETYPVTVDCPDFSADDTAFPLSVSEDCIEKRICPDTERFNKRDSFTGLYMNSFTRKEEQVTLRTAAYEPEFLNEGEKNPLLIWLHGQGEGGTDPDIEILGNEVSALTRDEIQSYFSSGEQTGAYVLAVQCETYWMDEGDGTNGNGSGVSRYTEALMDTIQAYVDSNPDVDAGRVYLGGCSNGGYMTINLLVNYPDYFSAAYPCCEAYAFYEYERNKDGSYKIKENAQTGTSGFYQTAERWMTDEKVNAIKNIPIWFVLSNDDFVVKPTEFGLPTYQALLKAGAENCWLSVYESVVGTDSPHSSYTGHFSWIYLFNNQVTGVQDREAVAASEDAETFGITPTNNGGGTMTAGEYDNIFAWLNAQSK